MRSIFAAILATALVSPALLANGADEMKINSITASGSACRTDSNGKPVDYSVIKTSQGKKQLFRVGFDNFAIESGDQFASQDCTIYVNVTYPAGKTIHTLNTYVEGSGDVSRGAKAVVRTTARVGSGRTSKNSYTIRAQGDDRWKSSVINKRSRIKAPCGGRYVRIALGIKLSLSGDDSFVSVGGSSSQFANIDYELKDCE